MTVVHSFPCLGTGISFESGIDTSPRCFNRPFFIRSPYSLNIPTGCARLRSSATRAASLTSARCSSYGTDQSQSQSAESTSSARFQPFSDCSASSDDGRSRGCYTERMDSTECGRTEEVLTLSLVVGVLLFPEQSSAMDMDTSISTIATTAQGLMGWAGGDPANALSLPTWIIHIASVAEWVAAMALVWKYGDSPGKSAWKGMTWGMVPLLGGAMCACTWHFFYNAPSLEGLVVLQGFLTLVGNFTLWIAAYRIWKASQEKSPVE